MPKTSLNLTRGEVSRDYPFSLVISDPSLDDNPLVYVSDAFEKVSGYARTAVIGRNCRFLQGKDTDPETVAKIADAIAQEKELQTDIYNYRADGTGFWNRLMVGPLKDDEGKTKFFVGIQHEIGPERDEQKHKDLDDILAEIQHRVKNHLSMVVGMIRLQARDHNADDAFGNLARRVEALQLLYSEMSEAGAVSTNDERVPLGAYLTRIASAISHIDGRESVRVIVDADKIDVPIETAARSGLVFSEILTNALQHAFGDRPEGVVEARAKLLTDGVMRITVMDDGTGMPEDGDWPNEGGLGSRIVRELVRGLNGNLVVQRGLRGTTINLDIPLDEQEELIARDKDLNSETEKEADEEAAAEKATMPQAE